MIWPGTALHTRSWQLINSREKKSVPASGDDGARARKRQQQRPGKLGWQAQRCGRGGCALRRSRGQVIFG